jgi:hypothetical protein
MKILVSGCSFTKSQPWPNLLFSPKNYSIKNVAVGEAGNYYISNSVTANLHYCPDFVFVLWSGLNRNELRVPNANIFKKFNQRYSNYKTMQVENSLFYLSGGGLDVESGWLAGYNNIKGPDWPEIYTLDDWFNLPQNLKTECLQHKIHLSAANGNENLAEYYHQYFLLQNLVDDQKYRSELTFQNVMNCHNLLEKLNIPYRFSFIYDIFSPYHQRSLGQADKTTYYDYIDWSKFISLTPYEYGIKNDYLDIDNFHLVNEGYSQWGTEVSKILRKQSDLQHLFK